MKVITIVCASDLRHYGVLIDDDGFVAACSCDEYMGCGMCEHLEIARQKTSHRLKAACAHLVLDECFPSLKSFWVWFCRIQHSHGTAVALFQTWRMRDTARLHRHNNYLH